MTKTQRSVPPLFVFRLPMQRYRLVPDIKSKPDETCLCFDRKSNSFLLGLSHLLTSGTRSAVICSGAVRGESDRAPSKGLYILHGDCSGRAIRRSQRCLYDRRPLQNREAHRSRRARLTNVSMPCSAVLWRAVQIAFPMARRHFGQTGDLLASRFALNR